MYERDAVSNLFPPPTANQSWRKVLSMGNLLNGHEPMQREIIFSVQERISNGHYSSPTPLCTNDEQIQTHRMYISGTSNDLWVALSVTSWDWAARCMRGAIDVLISLEFRWCRSTIIVIFCWMYQKPRREWQDMAGGTLRGSIHFWHQIKVFLTIYVFSRSYPGGCTFVLVYSLVWLRLENGL